MIRKVLSPSLPPSWPVSAWHRPAVSSPRACHSGYPSARSFTRRWPSRTPARCRTCHIARGHTCALTIQANQIWVLFLGSPLWIMLQARIIYCKLARKRQLCLRRGIHCTASPVQNDPEQPCHLSALGKGGKSSSLNPPKITFSSYPTFSQWFRSLLFCHCQPGAKEGKCWASCQPARLLLWLVASGQAEIPPAHQNSYHALLFHHHTVNILKQS